MQYVCTSGFMDKVLFSHNGDNETESDDVVLLARWRHQSAARRAYAGAKCATPNCLVIIIIIIYSLLLLGPPSQSRRREN